MDLEQRLLSAGQEHLLAHLDGLSPSAAKGFRKDLESVDWNRVALMHRQAGPGAAPPLPSRLRPVRAVEPSSPDRSRWRDSGLERLASGKAGFVLMAGGQGSRLGFHGPKGACPLGLPQDLTLFEILVRRLLRLRELSGRLPPFSIMTGPDNDLATREWFSNRDGPQLPSGWPEFFVQSSAPALDETGRALIFSPGRVALVPDGNGGIWERLRETGTLDSWKESGAEWIHVAGVDNLLSLPCDPVFLGFAQDAGHGLSVKTVVRTDPAEKVGVYALDGEDRPRVAEYTELPAETAEALDTDGLPVHREANIASHLVRIDLALEFSRLELPWHLARKRIQHVDPVTGRDLSEEAACKYERFLFDAFPAAQGFSLLRVDRGREFAPVKNARGADSPDTARAALSDLHRSWHASWGEPDNASWIDPLASFDGERPSQPPQRS